MADKAKAEALFRQMMTDASDIQGVMLLNLQTRAAEAVVFPSGKNGGSLADNVFKLYDSALRLGQYTGDRFGETIRIILEDSIVILNTRGTIVLLTLTKPQAKLGLIIPDIRRCLDTLNAD